jgi:Zn-dependent peptidase ImmA (M78 family)
MLCIGNARVIIINDGSSPARIAADIAHELSHLLLLHPSHRLISAEGGRHYDAELEAEANWLGPALLVSDEAAVSVARRGLSLEQAASIYGVSEPLMQMRLNISGAFRRAA